MTLNEKKTQAVRRYNKAQSNRKVAATIKKINEYVERGEVICVKTIAYECNVSRSFFYNNEKVRAALEKAKKYQRDNGIESRKKKMIEESLIRMQKRNEETILLLRKQLENKERLLEEANRKLCNYMNAEWDSI